MGGVMDQLIFMQGSKGPMVQRIRVALCQRLGSRASLYINPSDKSDYFDAAMDAAVRQWQSGSGLMSDGVVGPYNLQVLNLITPPQLACDVNSSNVQRLFPFTKPVNISRYLPYVIAALQVVDLTSRDMVLAALGTIRAETEGFVPISEGQSGYNTAPGGVPFGLYDGRLGNGPGDGALFKGRGFVQLTGRDNYDRYKKQLNVDIVSRPELANLPEVAALLLATFLKNHQGKLVASLATDDFKAARELVNGGTHGLDRFVAVFQAAKSAMPSVAAVSKAKSGNSPKKGIPAVSLTSRLKVRADAPDLRDREYMPPPVSLLAEWPRAADLKQWLPAYAKADLILDQGQEGACTGFGLAGVVNYLRWVQQQMPEKLPSVSPRMLYNVARRYDEYAGENYEGSSCRGALKGWYNHGVCFEEDWPYRGATNPRFGYAERARQNTLGVYYRIKPTSIADLQAAIQSVGAVYVSSYVHDGWQQVPSIKTLPVGHADLPVITFDGIKREDAGHAYALVGFNAIGFVLQNSWGSKWGTHGFAVLTYEDWAMHAMDAWVVALGVPGLIGGRATSVVKSSGLARGVATWSETEARQHAIMLGNDGRVTDYLSEDERTRSLAYQATLLPDSWFRASQPKEKKRLLIYVHGGLNSKEDGLKRARVLGRCFEANNCYPLFVVWQTGLLESIGDIFSDWRKSQPAATGLGDGLIEKTDALIESTVGRKAAKPIWSEMKENAALALAASRGGELLIKALVDLISLWGDQLEIHLIGHSAGSIWLGHLISGLQAGKGAAEKSALDWVKSVHLYAPACTVDFANTHYGASGILPRTYISLLSDQRELDDNTAYVYRKSLLYLVSNALEVDRRTPILGLQRVFDPAQNESSWDGASSTGATLSTWRKFFEDAKMNQRLNVLTSGKVPTGPNVTIPVSHGCFDNDIDVVTRTLETIIGGSLSQPIIDLRGF